MTRKERHGSLDRDENRIHGSPATVNDVREIVCDKIVRFLVALSLPPPRLARPSLINRSDYRLNVNEFPRDRRRDRGWTAVDHRSKERTGAGKRSSFRSLDALD